MMSSRIADISTPLLEAGAILLPNDSLAASPKEDPHYVHWSYLDDDDEYVSALRRMESSLQERLVAAASSTNRRITEGIRIQSCRQDGNGRGRRHGGAAASSNNLHHDDDNNNAPSLSMSSSGLYHVDGLAGCGHMLWNSSSAVADVITIFIYNPHPTQSRMLCGTSTIIAPGGVLRVAAAAVSDPDLMECLQRDGPSRWHRHIPSPHNAMEFPPIRIRNRAGDAATRFSPFQLDCNVPCEEEEMRMGRGIGLVAQRYIDGTDWKFMFSMEGGTYYPQVVVRPGSHRTQQFYSTTSFRSEVPAAYFSFAEYNLSRPAVEYDSAIRGASFLARNCASRNNREGLVKDIMQWRGENNESFRVDALSKCLRNAKLQEGWVLSNKVDIMRRYLFYLSFENSNEEDYITEKLWGALESGSLPVYFGAPNAKDHVPPNSLILANDFKDGATLATYLAKVAQNRTLYESYHEWRRKPLDATFLRKYNHTHTHSVCRLCRWSYARRYGLGFNHEAQTVQKTKLDRKACLDNDGWLSIPIIEKWQDEDKASMLSGGTSGECSSKNVTNDRRSRRIGKGQLKRTILEHDGVIDLHIDPVAFVNEDATFSLIMLMPDAVGGHWANGTVETSQHIAKVWIQTNESRITVLTRPKINAISVHPTTGPEAARIAMIIPSQALPLRIRIVVDDVDTFHAGAERETSYFAEQMEFDFSHPLEFFRIL